ncbi:MULTISPECIES: hypothetical protein [unclassified Mesorhizobium]|uniref:hypothetical protein n=1 Tax=unclassified Mesorhizobium TaxID=325217 RepID=UPI0016795FF6|nr:MULTISPECIES: hypothetical protein [unclassified Mesorhizobium]
MATKRTPLNRGAKRRISPDAVAAFRAGDHQALATALGLLPWQPNPLDVDAPLPPAWASSGTAWAQAWPEAFSLRQQLEAAR